MFRKSRVRFSDKNMRKPKESRVHPDSFQSGCTLVTMIEISQVSKRFRRGSGLVDAVKRIDLKIERREIVAIIGPSGCGKSTLLNMIAGLTRPTGGRIVYKGLVVSDVNTDVGYMTQKDNLLPWRTVRDNVAFPLELAGVPKA